MRLFLSWFVACSSETPEQEGVDLTPPPAPVSAAPPPPEPEAPAVPDQPPMQHPDGLPVADAKPRPAPKPYNPVSVPVEPEAEPSWEWPFKPTVKAADREEEVDKAALERAEAARAGKLKFSSLIDDEDEAARQRQHEERGKKGPLPVPKDR